MKAFLRSLRATLSETNNKFSIPSLIAITCGHSAQWRDQEKGGG